MPSPSVRAIEHWAVGLIELDGYRVHDTLAASESTVVVRAQPADGGSTVLVKLLRAEYPTPEQLARLRHEFDIAAGLPEEWAVRPLRVEQFGRRTGLVLTDTGGRSLADVIPSDGFATATFLRVATGLARALVGLHDHGLIHRDLKPANIIVDAELSSVRLGDFGLATRLTRTTSEDGERLEGTLAYLAPEQTGRMNRSVDQRSDLYSLGVTLYQVATGRLPFAATGAWPAPLPPGALAYWATNSRRRAKAQRPAGDDASTPAGRGPIN